MLVFSGFFSTTKAPNGQEEGQEAYVLTPSSKLLVKDNPNCLAPFVNSLLKPDFLTPGHSLGDWFRGDEVTVFEKAHGMAFWEYNDRNPEFNKLFNEAMASDSQMLNLVVANLQGTKNLNYVGGDMFQHIPSADVIMLKLILHGWSDEECLKILKKCKEAISSKGEGGKVIVIDLVINEKKDERELTETKLLFDMLMMYLTTGRERSEKEWEGLFLKAGFSHYKITPLLGLRSLIEVYT
ncbi:hypothetical protein GH714_016245 [Hevea brasiliensis]|uniref:O-methyltransferase C-terminal domain-containing protein n=1 Tax=Hevea brasiliensis TaxID=3981 RepID=A0A6A6LS25_HEVBR|nr:hypothetical protein GH714_016245 [Hevea brasiliensis]